MSALLWSCIWNWYIQSLIIALCAVLVLRHRNSIGYSTSIFRNHNLESFRILAWLPIFLQCIMLAHQAALYIKLSTSVEVINNNRKPYWLNESKYLWNFLMCPFVLHAVNSVVASHWHMLIISVDSSTNPSQSQFNQFEDAEPLFRHMVPHSPVHARSRANFIKLAFQRPKFCTEARDSVLKPAHTIGGCRSSPEARSQRSPWFSRPAIAASPESHILSDSARFKDLIIRRLAYISRRSAAADPRLI